VPVLVTDCGVEIELQNGVPLYDIVADGSVVIVTDAVAVTAEHPPDADIVYVIVYVPAELVLGVIEPVEGSIVRPPGNAV